MLASLRCFAPPHTPGALRLHSRSNRPWRRRLSAWDRRVFLEIHSEDTVEVLGNFDGRKLTLDELGLSEDDLALLTPRPEFEKVPAGSA